MVGTSIVAVIRCSSMVRSTTAGSNLGSTTNDPPFIRVGAKNAAPACDSGVQTRNFGDCGHSHSATWICVMVAIDCAVPTTPFGFPWSHRCR